MWMWVISMFCYDVLEHYDITWYSFTHECQFSLSAIETYVHKIISVTHL